MLKHGWHSAGRRLIAAMVLLLGGCPTAADNERSASAWARRMNYELVAVVCRGGPKGECSLRVKELSTPVPLICMNEECWLDYSP